MARQILFKEGNKFLEENKIHLHVPEGATPKDGPSAGITLVTSMLSIAWNWPINDSIAMTGEVSLKGKILKIGGLKEKLIAAKRGGVKTIIIPKDNQDSIKEIPQELLQDLNLIFAENYQDLESVCFS